MTTPRGFASGTIEYAKAKGIGLWRYVPEGSLIFLVEDNRGVSNAEILRALTTHDASAFRSYGSFYGLSSSGDLTTDREQLIREEFRDALL